MDEYDESFLRHAVANPSQYDGTTRALAQMALNARRDLVAAEADAKRAWKEVAENVRDVHALEDEREKLFSLAAKALAAADTLMEAGRLAADYTDRRDFTLVCAASVAATQARSAYDAAAAALREAIKAGP